MIDSLRLTLEQTRPVVPDPSCATLAADVDTVLDVVCDSLEASGCVQFVVTGFGQESWPVDVRTDLLTILEQLPEFTESIRSNEEQFVLDFFEQGIERRLEFARRGERLEVTCTSGTDWLPNPAFIRLAVTELTGMVGELQAQFVRLAVLRCPKLSSHAAFTQWADATSL